MTRRELFHVFLFVAAVAMVHIPSNAFPRDFGKSRRTRAAPNSLIRRGQNYRKQLSHTSTTVLERVQQPIKHTATIVPRYFTAAVSRSGMPPPPLPAEEIGTLTALYLSLNGPNWHIKDGWMSTSNPCGGDIVSDPWYGVECTAFESDSAVSLSSHVTGLVLPQNNLIGWLPPLRLLKHLRSLDLFSLHIPDSTDHGNFVSGTLDALCGLGNLSTARLSSNNFTGSIPDCIQSLANATVLKFDHNAIQGTTPESLCRLHNLEELILRGNQLQGSVPVCIGEALTALRVLDYSNVKTDSGFGDQSLSGTLPASLCSLENLEVLEFQATQGLSGTIPDCLGAEQPQLQVLALLMNQINGPIPEKLCQASALEQVLLYENTLTGTVPSCLGNLKQLVALDLYTNQFNGSIPEELCQASALEQLVLFDNALTGTVPSCLGDNTMLSGLDLSANQFYGPIPETLCRASALEQLILYENSLTGTIPSCLGSVSLLTWLEIDGNHFHGSIPTDLCHAIVLELLELSKNALTGTLPSCLGNLSQLTLLDLDTNQLHGPIPEELCQASALEILVLNDNALTGTIPSCLVASFPFLESMLLYNNNFDGALPSEWALPSLISVVLSNNPKLSGSMPSSLFLQQVTVNSTQSRSFHNDVLRAVVIEGSSIGGTLPEALCSAQQLVTLAVSGNELTGSLPNCIESLQGLQTLRVSNNHLTGTLPVAINNMTSLTVLDLSTNEIEGRVPAALGEISPNLETMQLQLNRLSCDLPVSVREWQSASTNVSFNLLEGNLFGCSKSATSGIFALSIQGTGGLRSANEEAFDSYSCGNSNYIFPAVTIAILAAPVVVWLALLYYRGRLALQWRIALEWRLNPSTLINELDFADQQVRDLALGVMAAATVAGSLAFVLSLNVAKSAFECEYMAAPTLANKGSSNIRILSIGVGAAASLGLVLGLTPWSRRLVVKCLSSTTDYSTIVAGTNKPLCPLNENADGGGLDADCMAEAASRVPAASHHVGVVRALTLVSLLFALVLLTIGPNLGYVLVVLSSQLTQQEKVASVLAITLGKTVIGTFLVPRVARNAVDLLVFDGALTFLRFRLRVAIATMLSAMTFIVLPVMIVLATDTRCLFYTFNSQPTVDTDVPTLFCLISGASVNVCFEYAVVIVTSTYTPSFDYDAEVCVSAVLSVYGPVFLGVVLLTATIPAGMETLVVPWLAPWCYRNAASSKMARTGLTFFHAVTWNVWPVLADAGVLPPDFSLGAAKLDYLAQRVVERAFVQMMATFLAALTFGIAVPIVGGACAVAAFVQLLHHRHVLGQIVELGRLEQPAVVPNLMGCTDIPIVCALVIVTTVVLVWVCGAMGYLDSAVIGVMLSIGIIMGWTVCALVAWWRHCRVKSPRHQDRAKSTASSDTPRGVLMESLLADDASLNEAESN
jgi:Leucine-rich repeat (LRR) protein